MSNMNQGYFHLNETNVSTFWVPVEMGISNTYLFGAVMPTYNLAAGVGLRIGKHTLIEARYVYPLKETVNQFGAKEGETGLEFNMRGYKISAGITLLF